MADRSPTRAWTQVGFGVPATLATAVALYLVLDVRTAAFRSGYEGLAFIGLGIGGLGLSLLWLGIGAAVAAAWGPPGSARAFASGAGVALGVVFLVFTVGCFVAIA